MYQEMIPRFFLWSVGNAIDYFEFNEFKRVSIIFSKKRKQEEKLKLKIFC